MKKQYFISFVLLGFILSSIKGFSQRILNSYHLEYISTSCYDRSTMPYTAVVDTHLHFRPFNVSAAPPFEEVVQYLRDTNVLFVNIYGIGQVLPATSSCINLNSCLSIPVRPSLRNDILNAENLTGWRISNQPNENQNIHFVLSMTFPDLSDPSSVLSGIHLLDREYPRNLFRWMGEVNLVKEYLFNHGMEAVPKSKIPEWEPFMATLRERDIPLAIHSDLGNDNEPTKYISWMEEVLKTIPKQ